MGKDRYELRIERRDGRRLRNAVQPVTEVFDLDDNEEFELVCGKHYVPMACAAEGSRIFDRPVHMPFLAEYVLEVWHRNRSRGPVVTSTSLRGFESMSRFD